MLGKKQSLNSQKLTRNEIVSFFQKEGRIRFDELENSKANFNRDFDKEAFIKFIELSNITPAIDHKFLLENLDCILKNGKLANADEDKLREDLPDWQKEEIKLAKDILFNNPDRYICIPERPSYEGYNLMVEFAEKVEDELLREKWFKFRDERLNKKVTEWLNSIGIESA